METVIRKALPEDLPAILSIYARAREFMRTNGNPRQWGNSWPPVSLLEQDIQAGRMYAAVQDGQVEAVFVYIQGVDVDPTYRRIENGSWMAESEYGAVHRLAAAGRAPGMGRICLDWALDQCGHLRVDTHGDNLPMQHLLDQLGFSRRGIIYVQEDNDPRIAFEKIRE